MDVEIVYEAIELFNRESLFWSRLESKGTVLPLVKVEAKYILLFYQTFNLAAGAAIRLYSKGILEDLKWNYIEVQQHIFPHRTRAARESARNNPAEAERRDEGNDQLEELEQIVN